MNENDLKEKNKELAKLLNLCDKLSSQMLKENRKSDYFRLQMLSQRIREIRSKIWLVRDLLEFWDKIRGSDFENDFIRFANYHLESLIVDLHIDIFYTKAHECKDYQFMELYFGWIKVCCFYKDYYTLKITFARHHEQ